MKHKRLRLALQAGSMTVFGQQSFAHQDDVWLEAKGSWLHYALEGLHCSLMS